MMIKYLPGPLPPHTNPLAKGGHFDEVFRRFPSNTGRAQRKGERKRGEGAEAALGFVRQVEFLLKGGFGSLQL